MLQNELIELIKQGEGSKLEFKRDGAHPESLAKEIAAFANMNGGRILLGVEEDGGISGIQKANFQEWLMNVVVGRYVSPNLFLDCQEVETDKGAVAVLDIPMGTTKPYKVKRKDRGDIYIRYDSVSRLADDSQIRRLFQSGGDFSAERFPVHGSGLDELDKQRYLHYFKEILQNVGEIDEKFLQLRDFLVGEEGNLSCSYFAYALFGMKPGMRLPKVPVRVTVFPGLDKDYETTLDEMVDVPYVGLHNHLGTVVQPIHEQVVNLLKPFISAERMAGITRKREWDYPPEAIREAVVNGLIHRDWTVSDYVRVAAYQDRLEIESPGALPSGMTIEAARSGVRRARNKELVRVFRDYDYLENCGMGIRRKIIPLCLEHSGREPEFEATEHYFKVIMRKRDGR